MARGLDPSVARQADVAAFAADAEPAHPYPVIQALARAHAAAEAECDPVASSLPKIEADQPLRGGFNLLKRIFVRFGEDRVMTVAGGVTFFSLLAIFPAIAALVSIYGLFSDPSRLTGQIQTLHNVLPSGGMEVLGDQMSRVASQARSALGTTFLISLAISLWSANSGMKALGRRRDAHEHRRQGRALRRRQAQANDRPHRDSWLPVHSFRSLLADLATYCRIQATTALNEKYVLTLHTRPTHPERAPSNSSPSTRTFRTPRHSTPFPDRTSSAQ